MPAPDTDKLAEGLPLDAAAIEVWRSFVVANTRLIQTLDEELRREHGLTLGDYDVLVQLSIADGQRLRMCDLADAVLLSPSGLSRRVERLERAALVERGRAGIDGRSVEARLTTAGKRLVRRLRITHLTGVKKRFADRFNPQELATLGDLLARLRAGTGS